MTADPVRLAVSRLLGDDSQPEEAATKVGDRHRQLTERLVDANDLRLIPPLAPLVTGIMDRNCLCWLQGKSGHGKSFVALDLVCHVATGTPWRSRDVAQGRVLYVVAEGASGMQHRMRAWEVGNRTQVGRGLVTFLPIAVQMLDAFDVAAFQQVITDVDPILVVIDTQARVTVGGEENSSKDMGRLVHAVDQLRSVCQSTIMIVHHEGRSGENMRGSTAMEGAADTVIRVTKDGPLIELVCRKEKDLPEFEPIFGSLLSAGQSVYWSHSTVGLGLIETETETAIIATMWDLFGTTGASSSTLREATGLAKSSFHRGLNSLVRKGKLRNEGTPRSTFWVVSDEDQLLVDP